MLALLPETWFAQQGVLAVLLLLVGATAVLIVAADLLVFAAAHLARRWGISTLVIGATVVALGTTSPEAAVSVLAAWTGNSGLALGNGIGSVIVDTGLILGVGLLLTRLPAEKTVLNHQGWVQLGAALLLCVLAYGSFLLFGDDAALTRPIGLLLVVLLVVYMVTAIRWSRQQARQTHRAWAEEEDESPMGSPAAGAEELLSGLTGWRARVARGSVVLLAVIGMAALAVVVFSSDVLVGAATELAYRWEVPQSIVAATLLALGTSLPELVVGLTAIYRRQAGLLVGTVIGADILNILFVIGFAALAAPLSLVETQLPSPARYATLVLHLPMMLVMLIYLRLCMGPAMRRGSFSRWMGVPLLAGYGAYLALQWLFIP